MSFWSLSPNSRAVTPTTPSVVSPIATFVPRCSSCARWWDSSESSERTKKAPTTEAIIPTAATASGKTKYSGVASGVSTVMKAAKAMGAMIDPA